MRVAQEPTPRLQHHVALTADQDCMPLGLCWEALRPNAKLVRLDNFLLRMPQQIVLYAQLALSAIVSRCQFVIYVSLDFIRPLAASQNVQSVFRVRLVFIISLPAPIARPANLTTKLVNKIVQHVLLDTTDLEQA